MRVRPHLCEMYCDLYNRLKSEQVVEFIHCNLPRDAHEVLCRIRALPHPDVVSERDIYEIAQLCVSGYLDGLYQLVGELAKRLRDTILAEYPYIESQKYPLPPPEVPRHPKATDIGNMLSWTNETLRHLFDISLLTKQQVDIVMKGQCPFCHGDLVTYIKGSELRLRCKNRSNQQCAKIAWIIGTATLTAP